MTKDKNKENKEKRIINPKEFETRTGKLAD